MEAGWCIYASVNFVCIGSDNGLSPVQHQAIIWTNADLLAIGLLVINLSEILMETETWPVIKGWKLKPFH